MQKDKTLTYGDEDMQKKTEEVHSWMKGLDDDKKMRFALNWKMPHTLFNVACAIRGEHDTLQGVDWYSIHKSRDMGTWSHGGPVIVQGGL